jgi:hypothetical protein
MQMHEHVNNLIDKIQAKQLDLSTHLTKQSVTLYCESRMYLKSK